MKIKKIIIDNYRGINVPTEINLHDFTCIVGKNDVGKSTILKALDIFLNDSTIIYKKGMGYYTKNHKAQSVY